MLSIDNHDRDVANLTYVYPVVSRRAQGVSLGINLNPNNKCNWQCVYCQVPNLQRGVGENIDLDLLKGELEGFLDTLLNTAYMQEHVPEGCRVLKDLAISGNGEPTTCPHFDAVVGVVVDVMKKYALTIPLRLITNGSSVHKPHVQTGLQAMAANHGEVWFKVDAVGEQATMAMNQVSLSKDWQFKQLQYSAELCPTWIQTCMVSGMNIEGEFLQDYLDFLGDVVMKGVAIKGVLLYSLARPSLQAVGADLQAVSHDVLLGIAQKIETLGLSVTVS